MLIRQNVISDPSNVTYKQYYSDITRKPSVVWQQQMGKAYIKTYKAFRNDRPDRYYDMDYTTAFETRFRPLQQIEVYDPHYIDTEYGIDPYWDNSLYDQRKLQFECDDYPPTDDEDDPEIPDNTLSRELIELWQPNSEINNEQETEEPVIENELQSEPSLLDESAFLLVLITSIHSLIHQPRTQIQKTDAIFPDGL